MMDKDLPYEDALSTFQTHLVGNQPPPFQADALWQGDAALREAVTREGAGVFAGGLAVYAALAGERLYALGFDANRDRPRLRTHDAQGHRIDEVDFHPAYHALMEAAVGHGVAGLSWQRHGERGAHVARAALSYLHHQVEAGTSCPLTMTHAGVVVLQQGPALAGWARCAVSRHYDPRSVPLADKRGITLGMGMTEKQGGSDVRSNATRAVPCGDGDAYRLVGHKWFMSAPMSDAFLVLAQAPRGLTCLLLPRMLDDGQRNAWRIMRLKDKLGDWSNASSEVEFCNALAWPVGEEGRGIATILDMVMLTRLDCMLGGAAQMRMALQQAVHHARHRTAFGARLVDQPLMMNVLADLALESEAATCLAMRVAAAVDAAPRDAEEAALARVLTAVGKYWICRRAPAFVNEAQECLGGAGYVEESMLPRLYRQAPLNAIWEGSSNIQCLDVLRALQRKGATGAALMALLAPWRGRHAVFDAVVDGLERDLLLERDLQMEAAQAGARSLVERIALVVQAALLLRAGSPMAEVFIASRLAGAHGWAMGTLAAGAPFSSMIDRACPVSSIQPC